MPDLRKSCVLYVIYVVYIENEGTGYLFKKWCHRQGKNPFEKEKSWHRKQTKFTECTYMRSLNSYFLLIFFFRRGAWKWIAISIILCSNPLLVVCFGFCFFLQHFDGREASLFFEGLKNNLENYGCGLIFEVRMLCLWFKLKNGQWCELGTCWRVGEMIDLTQKSQFL